MWSKCSNPECGSTFRPDQGKFYRFSEDEATQPKTPIRHFWLCDLCSRRYMLERRRRSSVLKPSPRHVVV